MLPAGQTTTTIVVTPTASTTYTVVGTYSTGCTGTATATVTVSSGPTIAISGTTTLCAGASTTLTASGGVSYSWSTGATTTSITVTPTTVTGYTVVGTDANGCTKTAVEWIAIDCPDFLYYDCFSILDMDVFASNPSMTTFGIIAYQHASPPTTPCSGSVTATFNNPISPTYTFSAVNPQPYPFSTTALQISSNHTALNLTGDFGLLNWTNNNPLAQGTDYTFELWDCTNPTYTLVGSDCITTQSGGNCVSVVTKTIDHETSQTELDGVVFDIFPNPTTGDIWIKAKNESNNNQQIEIFNLVGEKVFEQTMIIKNTVKINTGLQNGTYFISIKANNNNFKPYNEKITVIR